MRKITILLCGTSLLFSPLALAIPTDDLTNADVATQDKYPDFHVSGYVDGSYNNLVRNYFTSGQFNRIFDIEPNGLTLQQAAVTFAYQPKQGFGFVLNPILGRDANTIAQYGLKPSSQFDSQTFAVAATQIFVQNTQGPLTLMAGLFYALEGYEKVNPTLDMNYSRSALFYGTPGTHTGVRAVYKVNTQLSLTAGINDGWDTIRDWGLRKTVEFNVSYLPNNVFSLSFSALNGGARATPHTDTGPTGVRTLFDVVATYNVTQKLNLVANYDYGWQTKATLPYGNLGKGQWQVLAGYVNYVFNEKWQHSFRAEIFEDPDGFVTGVKQNWRELTYSLGFSPFKNAELIAEVRHDFSNQNAFTNKSLVDVSPGAQSYALEAYYKFG